MGKHVQASGTPTAGQVPTYNGSSIAWADQAGSGASLAFANLDSGGGAATANIITNSVSPAANKLLLLEVEIRNGASTQPTTPTVTGNGLTWVLIDHADNDTTSSSRRTIFLFRAMGSAPTPGAITITFGETETDAAYNLDQVTGADTGGTNGSTAIVQHVPGADTSGSNPSLSITVATAAKLTNAIYAVFGTDGANTPVAGTGMTLLGHGANAGVVTVDSEYTLTPRTAIAMSWAGNGQLGGIAIEITANAATAAPVTSVAGRIGAVTLTADDTPDGSTNKAYTGTEKTKLAGVATGADVTATQLPVAAHAATSKATPVDADELPLADSAASFGLKKLTWANLKATAKTYFDTIYAALVHTHVAADVTNFDTQVRTSRLDQMAAPTADLSINSHKLTSVTDPTAAQDAATKAYVDAVAQGLSVKGSVRLATAAALPANTYLAGVITITATGVLTVDGSTVALNDRLLVKNEAAQLENGVYICTTAGAIGVAAVLTRSSDMDASAEFPGAFVFAESGTANAAAGFVCTNSTPPTVGTTAITFTQFSGAGELTAGTGLTKSANTLSIDTTVTVDKTTAQTLTSKRVTKRTPAVTQSATPTINTDNTDVAHITGLAQAITSMTTNLTGTPVEGDTLRIDITDNGTARAITWGASFEASTCPLPTTTVISTRLDVGFVWNTVTSKWRCVSVA
jgi:hypothetical protein